MEKNIEVEYRALISPDIFQELFKIGQEKYHDSFTGPSTILDAYFCPVTVTEFSQVEMDTVGSYSLRLREQTKNGVTSANINTKTITSYGDHNAWEEHESAVGSYKEAEAILKTIGFKQFFVLEKDRYTYQYEDILVCLENIKDFQPVIEVEIVTTPDKKNDAKAMLLAFLTSHGIKEDAIVTKSVTNLLMRSKAQF